MNLHGIVRGAIQAVNPDTTAIWQQNIGYTIANDGAQVPVYNTVSGVPVQVQGVSSRELAHTNYLNIEAVYRRVYLFGSVNGVVRTEMMGGDLLTFNDYNLAAVQDSSGRFVVDGEGNYVRASTARVWKVMEVSERWPDMAGFGWSSAIVCLQTDQAGTSP